MSPARPDPLTEPEFKRYAQRLMTANAERYSLLLLACLLAWWPVDFLLWDDPRLLAGMSLFRVLVLVVIGLGWASPLLRRRLVEQTAPSAALWLSAGMFAAGFAIAGIGTVTEGWLHYLGVPTLVMVAPVVARPLRIRLACLVALGGPAGFFLRRPDELLSPGLPDVVLFYAATAVFSVVVGDAVTRRLAVHFDRERETEAQRVELDRLSRGLEDRVAEQTAELRALARDLQEARRSERRWMAHEMHDGLGQQVASLGYSIAFVKRVGPESPGGGEVLDESRALLDSVNQSIAAVLERLRPEVVERGLHRALEVLVRSLGATWPVRPELSVDLRSDLDPDTAVAAYRVVQEGLSNALKHARAASVSVVVSEAADGVHLEVHDDGIGFDPLEHSWSGFGLSGIRSRVEELGGDVDWHRVPDGGTVLRARLPLPETTP